MADKYAEQTKGMAGVKKEKQTETWESIKSKEKTSAKEGKKI